MIRDFDVFMCNLRPRVGPYYILYLLVCLDRVSRGSGEFQTGFRPFWAMLVLLVFAASFFLRVCVPIYSCSCNVSGGILCVRIPFFVFA